MPRVALYTVLVVVAGLMLVPFYWMLVMATHSTAELFQFPPPFWFGENAGANYATMAASVDFFRAFLNSCLVSVSSTVLVLFFCSAAGYAFAMHEFPGRETLFAVLLATMMIPWTAGIIPWFFLISKLGWLNSFLALIVPGAANAFGIFWMRQYCRHNVPASLLDAARIDGVSEWTLFFRVVAPLLAPGFAALGIMVFVGSWNDFMAPLLVLRDNTLHTLPLMLKYLSGDPVRGSDKGALMLANALAVLPLLGVFLLASQYFMSGLTAGAIKE